ncbi:unnamed protein product [Somion occarium]|uniref:Fungal-type protein kinase domain-containing protein n=1 Tax=Somion occarium TaxID=3059160 RepID=A0ABP1CS17_9APHY
MWASWGAYGELKKRRITPDKAPVVTNDMLDMLGNRSQTSQLPGGNKSRRTQSVPSNSQEETPPSITETPTSSWKRKAGSQHESSPPKRRKIVHTLPTSDLPHSVSFTEDDFQAAKYVDKLISQGIRSYASGFLVEETKMSLWYTDRMGLVKSKRFDIFDEPEYFLLVIAALHFARPPKLGFNPLIEYTQKSIQSYEKGVLKLSRSYDITGRELKDLSFLLNVLAEKPLTVARGAVGRGTTVLPIQAIEAAKNLFEDEGLVAKFSWQPTDRVNTEDGIIRVIRQKIGKSRTRKHLLKHIVDLKCSLDLTATELGLPRASMYLSEACEPRIFRVLIVKEYLPLECVRRVAEYERIFIDVVQVHRYVFDTVKILHGDISVSNVMFYREPGGNVIGVLSDWDLSTYKNGPLVFDEVEGDFPLTIPQDNERKAAEDESVEEQLQTKKPRSKAGTGPFMALDLLGSTPILHRYRHDLESFFYLLCYFCATFVPSKPHQTEGSFKFLPGWEDSNLKSVCIAKKAFLNTQGRGFQTLFAETHKSYRPLLGKWVEPLWLQFNNIRGIAEELENTYGHARLAWEFKHVDGEAKYLESLQSLKKVANKADRIITYKKFVEVILKYSRILMDDTVSYL